jgi:hypothetical protein
VIAMILPTIRSTTLYLFATLSVALAHPANAAGRDPARDWLLRQGYAAPTSGQIVACHGYGCVRRAPLAIDSPWLARAEAVLRAAQGSAAAERRALGDVVSVYTAALAKGFGGRPDVPRSPPRLSGANGQMDCLDVTANTTSLLLVLQERGLLAYHTIEPPQSRGVFFDGRYPHYTAVIVERRSGARWAVDPWPYGPGHRPDILPLARWQQAA